VRLAAAGAIPLTEDEAYYRLWSFAPALGYYDHPPMIAWWIALGRTLAGDNPLGVRLLPIVGGALTTLLVFDLARLAGADRRAANLAAVFFAAMLLVAVGGILAVPDAPTCLFWTMSLWCGLKARGRHSSSWWLAAGLAAGLASLSKYSALFLAPGLGLWLLSSRDGRAELRRPGPWLAVAVALGLFGLNVGWNAQHHWLTFARQFGRVGSGGFAPVHLLEFVVGQFLLINPFIAVLAARAIARRRPGEAPPSTILPFAATSAPFLFYLLVHSLHARVEAHWPAPIYPAIALCAAAGAESASGVWARISGAAPVFGFTLGAAALAWLAVPAQLLSLPADPALPVRGWPKFAERLEADRQAAGAAWIGTASYGLAAQLEAQGGLRAPVFEIYDRFRYQGLAGPERPDFRRPGLIVDLPRRIDLAALGLCFADVRPAGLARRGDGGGPYAPYAEVLVSGPKGNVLVDGCPR
jgi:4-amino-4-deoxy-L-arabinose transferase-like glycosyltransferase